MTWGWEVIHLDGVICPSIFTTRPHPVEGAQRSPQKRLFRCGSCDWGIPQHLWRRSNWLAATSKGMRDPCQQVYPITNSTTTTMTNCYCAQRLASCQERPFHKLAPNICGGASVVQCPNGDPLLGSSSDFLPRGPEVMTIRHSGSIGALSKL